LRLRLRALARGGDNLAKEALRDLDAFYDHVMLFYHLEYAEELDSQTPIMDAIMRFLTWLEESGLLELLLKLFLGMMGDHDDGSVWAEDSQTFVAFLSDALERG
jgi:hypothetical protein